MLFAFSQAFLQLSDSKIRRLALISVAMTVAVYLILFFGLAWVMFGTRILGSMPLWDTVLDWAAVIVVPLAALFLFPVVGSSFMGVFLEQVVEAVEARHYPGLPAPHPQTIGRVIVSTARPLALSLIVNMLLLPVYLLFPVAGQVGFYVVNGYLIGWEYFELVALRRLTGREVARLRGAHGSRLLMAGAISTLMLTIPILNLLAPVVGVAAMTHLAHRLPNQPLRAGVPEASS